MKNILYLGSLFLVLIGTQIYLEQENIIAPQKTDTGLDGLKTGYKIDNGNLYFLGNDGNRINKNHFVWQGANGHYYLEDDGQIFESKDGSFWNLLSVDRSIEDNMPSDRVNLQ